MTEQTTESAAPAPELNVTASKPHVGMVKRLGNMLVNAFMPDDEGALKRSNWLERRFQSAILSIMTTAVVWGVFTLASVDKSQAETTVKLENIEVQISGMYPSKDAKRDLEITGIRLDVLTNSLGRVEGRVDSLEDFHRGREPAAASASKPRK